MDIVIAGDGEVGLYIAKELAAENHNITIVDPHEELLNNSWKKAWCKKNYCKGKQFRKFN
jgi:Trk K+ transport system NAD-binding subunit